MRVAGVSFALTRAVLARGSSSCPSCNGPLVRARCAPVQRRDRLHGDAKRRWLRLAAGKSRQRRGPAGHFAAVGSGTHTVIALGWMETFSRLVRLRAPPSSS